jgi:hypothetical protein
LEFLKLLKVIVTFAASGWLGIKTKDQT